MAGSASPAAEGLDSGARATPAQLAVALFGDHVVVMELTGLLLIIAAVGTLALTHRERIRPRITQRTIFPKFPSEVYLSFEEIA